jgi:hypothetical protein
MVAVRWRNYRMYPKNWTKTSGNPSMGGAFGARTETNGYPLVFNIFSDPKEEHNIIGDNAWVMGAYLKAIGAYTKSLVKDPNPPAFSLPTGSFSKP